ncbi:hypothetical protein [Paraburkholderia bengalensis]|uniref:hypothetical protein n=1 Tax=Paraburkholderia bengalensis TaxID=2747562 RepID=UPI003AF52FED
MSMESYARAYHGQYRLRGLPGALDALSYASQFGKTAILSDGVLVFQPRKVSRSELRDEAEGRVLDLYIHKELMLDDVIAHYPARHYVMIDDKLCILTAMKEKWGDRLTTIFPRQGHYALDAAEIGNIPTPTSRSNESAS